MVKNVLRRPADIFTKTPCVPCRYGWTKQVFAVENHLPATTFIGIDGLHIKGSVGRYDAWLNAAAFIIMDRFLEKYTSSIIK